jgi:hypothetical protein
MDDDRVEVDLGDLVGVVGGKARQRRDQDAVPPGDAPQFAVAGLRRLASLLGKARADDDCGPDTAAAAFASP